MKKRCLGGLAVLLSAFLVIGLAGCGSDDQEPEPIDGGTTNKTDSNAPKTIESSDITSLDASFWLDTRWSGDRDYSFNFLIEDKEGVLTVSEKERGISAPADDELLAGLQSIIERYDLASKNGVYEVTAGLPPEYQEGGLTVTYASGETLTFTINNDPCALWSEDMYDLFAAWFLSKGVDALEPAPEESRVKRLNFYFKRDGRAYDYRGVNVGEGYAINGETYLLEGEITKVPSGKEIKDNYILFPDDYYENVTAIIADTDVLKRYDFSIYNHEAGNVSNHDAGFYGMGNVHPDYSEPDSDDLEVDIYIEYESGRRFNIETKKASEIEGLGPLLDKLFEYHESLF